jgi:hypothetical protein
MGLLKLMKNPNNHFYFAIDKYWFQLQEKDNWYLIVPLTVVQLEGFSDIEQREINYYGNLMLDLDKKEFFRKQQLKREQMIKKLLEIKEKETIENKMNDIINSK